MNKINFEAKIICKFSLNKENVKPLFLCLNRNSYLSNYYSTIYKHFYISLENKQIKFKYKNKELKDLFSIGFLFDYFSYKNNLFEVEIEQTEEIKEFSQVYFYTVKQACHILSTGVELSQSDYVNLFDSISLNYEKRLQIINKILNEKVKNLPVRLYHTDLDYSDYFQGLFGVYKEKDEFLLVRDVLESALISFNENLEVVCFGVEIPLDTPLAWLYYNFLSADFFLHLLLK